MSEAVTATAARRFIRARTRRGEQIGWADRYMVTAAVVILGALAITPVRAIAEALSTSEPRPVAPGLLLVAVSTTAAMAALRWLGPVALPANDVHWLLLSPLPRRDVLRKPVVLSVLALAGTASAAGLAALSALGARDHAGTRMALAMLLTAALAVAGWVVALHAQRSPALRWAVPLAGLAAAPVLLLTRTPLLFNAFGTFLVVLSATGLGVLAHRTLARFPAAAVVAASQRLGTAVAATVGLQPSDFTRAAEDRYWRARRLRSRPWPSWLPAPLLMAWPDWRMLGRRPGRLVLIAASTTIPALFSGAAAAVVLFGLSLAVASAGTTTIRRSPGRPKNVAVALLPILLAAAWLAVASSLLPSSLLPSSLLPSSLLPSSLLPLGGGWWWLLGVVAAPSVAIGAIRMAGRGPIDHTSMPIVMPMSGSWIPTGWLIWCYTGLDVAVPGCLPLLLCLFAPPVTLWAAIGAQTVVSATILGVWCAGRRARVLSRDGH